MTAACIAPAPVLVVVLTLSALLVALWTNAYGACRKCNEGRREPGCVACRGGGDPHRPTFNDPLSRRKRGEK